MAEIDPTVEQRVQQSIGDSAPIDASATSTYVPIYRMLGESKIPISRHEGKMWLARKDMGMKANEGNVIAWREAEAYYSNSQMDHRKTTEGEASGNTDVGKNKAKRFSHTENIVYSTVNAVIPATYAKNPSCEVTMFDPALEKLGVVLEHLGNRLAAMKFAPGINLKPKVTKSILRCEIANEAWVMVGYTTKEFSADQAREDIQKLGAELLSAKNESEIQEIEGKLMALEESVDLLDPAGPFVKSLRSEQVVIDPYCSEDDFSDANWKMVYVMLPTNYLNAKFRIKDDNGQWTSQYEATHVADANTGDNTTNATQREIDSFKMLKEDHSYGQYGYKDQKSFDRAKMTKTWYCFDRVKRRFCLYADNDWTWPIWVFDDPYHLPRFYPLHRLQFHTDPNSVRTKGEVSHYLDQQDTINTINDAMHRARVNVNGKVLFDANTGLTQQTVEALLNDANTKAVGVRMPEGVTIDKALYAAPLPAFQYKELWDKGPYYEAANKISGVGAVLQGAQFKTNTTNQAIDAYSSVSNQRIDAKIDAVEDFVGDIMFDVLFLCAQFMDAETVQRIVGQQTYQQMGIEWTPMDPSQLRDLFSCTVAGGSTQKPTSAAKKKEALEVGQVLGQFAAAAPQATIIMMQMMERAFDGIVMTDADWAALIESVQMAQQAQMNPGAAGGDPDAATEPGEGTRGDPDAAGESNEINALVQEAAKRGVPPEIARAEIQKRMGQPAQSRSTPA